MHTSLTFAVLSLSFVQAVLGSPLPSNKHRAKQTTNLSTFTIPVSAPEALPSPTGTLTHVLIGRGVQNYTCSSKSASETPAPIGAIATLYDASSVPDFSTSSALITSLAYSLRLNAIPTASDDDNFSRYANMDCTDPLCATLRPQIVGVHYFKGATEPMFDLNTANGQFGSFVVAKKGSTSAPKTAQANSVDWLLLEGTMTTADQSTKPVSVYRVDTVGGKPPKTCEHVEAGNDGVFTRNYAAQYWFYV